MESNLIHLKPVRNGSTDTRWPSTTRRFWTLFDDHPTSQSFGRPGNCGTSVQEIWKRGWNMLKLLQVNYLSSGLWENLGTIWEQESKSVGSSFIRKPTAFCTLLWGRWGALSSCIPWHTVRNHVPEASMTLNFPCVNNVTTALRYSRGWLERSNIVI